MDDLEKALVDIVRTYLSQETNSINNQEVKQDVNGNTDTLPNRDSESSEASSEFTTNVYQCLRDKGVLKEVHAFLRYKLVDVLQEKYPQVIKSGCDTKFDRTAIDLVEDFLIAHKLLFTYSVLSSELNGSYCSKRESGSYAKLLPHEAEALLENLNIPRDSLTSKQILRIYAQDEHRSLIECFVDLMPMPTKDSEGDQVTSKDSSPREALLKSSVDDQVSLRESEVKSQRTDISGVDGLSHLSAGPGDEACCRTNGYSTMDKKFLRERLEVELNKNLRNQGGIRSLGQDNDDLQRLKNEIESSLHRKLAAKEVELEKAFSEKLAAMKRILDQEKQNMSREKAESEDDPQVQKHKLNFVNNVRDKRNNRPVYDSPQTDISTADEVFNDNPNLVTRSPKARVTNRKPQVHFDSPMSNGNYQQQQLRPLKKDKVPDYSSFHLRSLQDDKVAFLQLSLEKQSEEIRKLQSELQRKNSLKEMEPVKLVKEPTTVDYDPELETFLEESKRRFADIELQAAAVTSTLRQVFQRANNKQNVPVQNPTLNGNVLRSRPRPQHVINPPKPSFLTDRGSFRSNLRSFLTEDVIPSDDFNFPRVLQTMPNTVTAHQFPNAAWRPQPVSQNPTLTIQPSTRAATDQDQQFSPVPSKLLTVRTEASTDLTRPRPPPTFAPDTHVTFELPPFLQSTASASSKATSCSNINVNTSAQLRSSTNLFTLHGPTPILSPPKRLNEVTDTVEKVPGKITQEVASDTDLSLKLAKRSGAFVTSKIQSRSNSIAEDEPVQTRKKRSNSRDKGQVVSSNQLMRDESVSVQELSHVDGGDTSDNMAEDDFWAI